MVLSGAEYSMTVMASFPLPFVAILSRGPFSINVDILGFSQNCSYTVLALFFRSALGMPRTESSSVMSQGIFGLSLYVLGHSSPRLGPWTLM